MKATDIIDSILRNNLFSVKFTAKDVIGFINSEYEDAKSVKNLDKKIKKILGMLCTDGVVKRNMGSYVRWTHAGNRCPFQDKICTLECEFFEKYEGHCPSAQTFVMATCYFNDVNFDALTSFQQKTLLQSQGEDKLIEMIEKSNLKESYPF